MGIVGDLVSRFRARRLIVVLIIAIAAVFIFCSLLALVGPAPADIGPPHLDYARWLRARHVYVMAMRLNTPSVAALFGAAIYTLCTRPLFCAERGMVSPSFTRLTNGM